MTGEKWYLDTEKRGYKKKGSNSIRKLKGSRI
jgi:hypothetical protein